MIILHPLDYLVQGVQYWWWKESPGSPGEIEDRRIMGKLWTIPAVPMQDLEGHLLIITARRWVDRQSARGAGYTYTVVESDVIDVDRGQRMGLVAMMGLSVVDALTGLKDVPLVARLERVPLPDRNGVPMAPAWRLVAATEDEYRQAEQRWAELDKQN